MKSWVMIFSLFNLLSVTEGAVYSYSFTGRVDAITQNEDSVLGNLEIGDAFSGSFSYNDISDTEPLVGLGEYHQNATISIALGDHTIDHSGFTYIRIWDDLPAYDSFTFGLDDATSGDWLLYAFGFTLTDNSESVFDSDSLPVSFDISDFDSLEFSFVGERLSSGERAEIYMEIQDISPIPEPSTITLLGIASAIIWKVRKRRLFR